MAFSQTTITDARAARDGVDLLIVWSSTAPAGTLFQVYVSGMLAWHGTARSCVLPAPPAGEPTRIDVGTVAATEGLTDFSADLPAPAGGGNRVLLEWIGGLYLGADLAGYRIYSGTSPGGAVSYAAPVATVAAYTQGIVSEGYGDGGYGDGGYGDGSSGYSWTSGPLAGGTWNFAVRPFDEIGNEGAASTYSAVIAAPPPPPAANAAGKRLTYTYNGTTHSATLAWLASA
jgi:hypothetical protein